jgi:dTDP-glucose 4,6-dehydratase
MIDKQTVIITGGSGFIGANLVRLLVETGSYRVVNLDLLTYAANPLSLADLEKNPNYIFVHGNICDRELVDSVLKQYQPAGIIHLAAESHVDRSIVNAEDFVRTNVVGTFTLLEASRVYWASLPAEQQKSFRFVHVSTDEVYGSLGAQGFFSEQTSYAPNSPYSASKAASDHFARAYHHTHGLPTITTNCSNNYGPYQFPEKMIPLMILNALTGESLPVYGDGSNVRDWVYVEDHCRALQLVLEKGVPGETYVIGANNEIKNLELVHEICKILDEIAPVEENPALREKGLKGYADLVRYVTDRPGHDFRYAIDAGKIRRELGWEPLEVPGSGLRKTIEWYLSNPEWIRRVQGGSYDEWLKKNYAWRTHKGAE